MQPNIGCIAALLAIGLSAAGTAAQQGRLADSELAAITARGRALAAYDQAVWHATDAVETANPRNADGQHCLARFENERWTVVFGSLNADRTRFLISYEAMQQAKPGSFRVTQQQPPREDSGFYLFAALALETALADFGRPSRPFSAAVLPAAGDGFYVYLYPAQQKAGSYPLGGDVRYRVSAGGENILEKRPLHKTILETVPGRNKKKVSGVHTHVTGDVPEDSDVLHVLQQDPPVPEIISTAHFVYEILTDGSIRVRQEKK